MSDVTYGVNVEYLSTGNLNLPSAGIDKATASMKGLSSATMSFVHGLDRAMTGLAVGGIAAALGGSIAILKVGLVTMNAEIEQMAIGMAAMFSAHGNVDSFNDGLIASKELIGIMRKDARELPGEFKDLSKIMSTMATPALNAGMSVRETEKLAANAMASGMTHGIAPAVIGREMAAIIAGSARSNMPMLTRGMLNLQVGAKELNAMPSAQRLSTINKALGLAGGPEAEAMNAMKKAHMNSWIGLTSTIKDQVKQILGTMSEHLFERMKAALTFVSNWFSTNGPMVTEWAERVGWQLAKGFTYAFHQLARLEPLLVKFGNILGKEASAGKLPGDIAKILAAGAALKVGTSLGSSAIGAMGAGGVAEGAIAGAGALGIATTGGLIIGVLAALGGALAMIYGAFEGLSNAASPLSAAMNKIWNTAEFYFADAIKSIGRSFEIVEPILRRIAEFLGGALLVGLEMAAETFSKFAHAIENMLNVIATNPIMKALLSAAKESLPPGMSKLLGADYIKPSDRPDQLRPEKADLDKKVAHPPVHNTTNHNNITIKVMGEADPSRVARKTVGLLRDALRNPNSARQNPASNFNTQ